MKIKNMNLTFQLAVFLFPRPYQKTKPTIEKAKSTQMEAMLYAAD
jgi:hypothetical protein